MKAFRVLLMVPLIAGLLAGAAVAREYGKMGGAQPMMDQSMRQTQMMQQAGAGVFFQGTLTGLNLPSRELLVSTNVLGLTGPQKRDIPFRISQDTTLTICFKSMGACDGYSNGIKGFDTLSSFEATSLGKVAKNVVIVGEPDSNRVVHAQIEYLF